jgi:colanic acid/amylovoran biosynthesis glycosyltransferase
MKKIAFILQFFPDKARTFEVNHIINAANAGYDIRIFPSVLRGINNSSQVEIIDRYGLMNKVIEPANSYSNKLRYAKWLLNIFFRDPRNFIPLFIKTRNPLLFGKDAIKIFFFRRVVQFYGNVHFDIFHCQYGYNGLIAARLKELGLLKGKIITTFHGIDAHFNRKHLKSYYRSNIRTWSPLLFKHSDLVTANTPYLVNQLLLLGANPDKIELLPMGIDISFFLPKENPSKKKKIQLISVGRLSKEKGHELGIKVALNLVKEGFNFDYLIVGDGKEKQNLKRLIEKYHLIKYVTLLGAKTQNEIKKLLQESDLFLMTSTYDETGRREAQGVAIAEAQACGLPVVAFRSGGIPYTLEEGKSGLLAEENDVTGFTQHIKNLCTDGTLRKRMGRNSRKFIEDNFCQTKLAEKQISLYEKVLLQ